MAGPWEKYQQTAQPVSDGPWAKYAQKPTQAAPVGGDMRALTPWENLTTSLPVSSKMPIMDAVGNFGHDALAGALNLVAHPIDSIGGAIKSVLPGNDTPNPIKQTYDGLNTRPGETIAPMIGQAAVTAGLGKFVAKPLAAKVGPKLQDIAVDNLNRRMNVGTKDRMYGQNPGRGVLNSGIGTSTREGLQGKIQGAKDANGALLSSVIDRADANANAPRLTPQQLGPYIDGPIDRKIGVVQGPGNHVANASAPLEVARSKYAQPAPGASSSIYGPNAPSTVLPSDLWKTVQNIDQNTRFNPQPEIETMNEVGRDIRGGLRSQLETVDPSIKPISQNYSDLSSAQTAIDRQGAPYYKPQGVKSMVASTVDSYPVNTAVSSGLYKAGGFLNRVGGNVAMGPAGSIFSPKMQAKPLQLESSVPGNAGYGSDFTQGGFAGRPPVTPTAPPSLYQLPASTEGGPVQPMVGIRANTYPPLAEDFARTRIKPTQFSGPPQNPLGQPRAFLNSTNPPKVKGKVPSK